MADALDDDCVEQEGSECEGDGKWYQHPAVEAIFVSSCLSTVLDEG